MRNQIIIHILESFFAFIYVVLICPVYEGEDFLWGCFVCISYQVIIITYGIILTLLPAMRIACGVHNNSVWAWKQFALRNIPWCVFSLFILFVYRDSLGYLSCLPIVIPNGIYAMLQIIIHIAIPRPKRKSYRGYLRNIIVIAIMILDCLCACVKASAEQTYDNVYRSAIERIVPLSPQASIMQRFGEYTVDYSTGVPDIKIPLYDIQVGEYSHPISIAYHPSGIKVQDISSPVGLGWSLMAGGVITREVRGGVDNGYFKFTSELEVAEDIADYLNIPNSHVAMGEPWASMGAGTSFEDSESDRYHYSFCGKSGVFRRKADDYSIVTVPYTPLKVEDYENGFRIIDTDGNSYFFTAEEKQWIEGNGYGYYTSAWYLTKILLSNKTDSIVFNYIDEREYVTQSAQHYVSQGPQLSWNIIDWRITIYQLSSSNEYATESYFPSGYIHSKTKLLSSIIWKAGTIEFSYAQDRQDFVRSGRILHRMTGFKVEHFSDIVLSVELNNNSYFGDDSTNYRLKLESLDIKGNPNSDEKMHYAFSYNSVSLPEYYEHIHHSNCHEDYWGYYNGTNHPLSWIPQPYNFSINSYPGADRSADNTGYYTKACILEHVSYPTGGEASFSYEPNRLADGCVWGGLRIKSITSISGQGESVKQTFEYEEGVASMKINDSLFHYSHHIKYNFLLC